MRNNGSVTAHEIDIGEEQVIVSRTDCLGRIVYVNDDFVEISGYTEEELLGQPHNMVRHPEMPAAVFADLWTDLKAGRPWIGIIQNRTKNGDAYWVEAHVSPIWEKGIVTGYMSMRRKASPGRIEEARTNYARLRDNNPTGVVFRHGMLTSNKLLPLLRQALAETPIYLKLFVSSLLAGVVLLAGFSYLLAGNLSRTLDDEARNTLRHEVGLVRSAVAAQIESARHDARDQAKTLSARIYRAMGGIKNAAPAALEALIQRASHGDENPISTFLDDLPGVGTIFVRTPEGFRRLMTNATDERGASAVGTFLAAEHPALPALLAGKSYVGMARVFAREYMTNYLPITDAKGEVIGATVIGIDLGKHLETLKEQLRGAKIGVSGYYYIVNVAPGPEFGRMILHPYKEGQLVGTALDQEGRNLTEEMARRRSGEILYFWKNSEAGETEARKKLMIFESLDNLQWVVAAGTTTDEFTALSNRVVWLVLLGGLALTVAVLTIVLILVRKLIFRPLNRQVLPTFYAMSVGKYDTQLDIRGNDEMAQVVQGLECLRNRLAYEGERERALSRMQEKARQEAEALSRSRAEFLSNMSHEIRTPLNAVIGLAYLLLRSKLGTRETEYVRRIEGAGKLLLAVVNDVLDFSKIDAGRLQLEEAPFHLDEVLDNLSNLLRGRAQEKKLVLEYVVAPDVPQALRGDALRLSQILINLVSNAIKFTTEGSITVFVNARPLGEEQSELEFRIQDSGIGMTKEQMANLFQAFAQADSSVTRKFGGTGLGLAICKRLVEMMGGSIWIDSHPQVGSTFSFRIRLGVEKHMPAPLSQSDYCVLVVDDNRLARSVLEQLLVRNGCSAQTVDSGVAALAALDGSGSKYDCIMIDLNMPDMDGLRLAEQIRAHGHRSVKLVMVSGENFHATRPPQAFGIFDSVMEKPVTAARISEVLAQLQDASSKPVMALPADPQPVRLAGLRVLVAEDVPTNQMIMRDLLESLGASVTVADNGQLAVTEVSQRGSEIDLVLMDIQMPEMDGLEACRRIRAGAQRADIPIIALTAHALEDERQRAVAAGMNDFLTKPIEPEQMIEVIQRWRPKMAPLTVPPETTDPLEDGPALPELPGINVVDGMHHVLNRRPLYEKILLDFQVRFTGEAGRIRDALASNNIELAARLAHSLKGTGATIGAAELAAAAGELEQEIKRNGPAIADCLNRFEQALNQVTEGIRTGLGSP